MNNIDKRLDEISLEFALQVRESDEIPCTPQSLQEFKESLKALMSEFKDTVIGEDTFTSDSNGGIGFTNRDLNQNNLRRVQRQRASDLLNRSSR